MEQRLRNHLRRTGYKKLYTDAAAVESYFFREMDYVNVIVLYDADQIPSAGQAYYRDQVKRITWRFHDRGQEHVHLLTLIMSSDGERAQQLAAGDRFCWIVDRNTNTLVIPEGAVENFYGVRDELLGALSNPALDELYMEAPIEYEAGGKPCIRHIGERAVVNHALLLLNLMGYLLCIMFVEAIYDWGDLRYTRVLENGEWYRILTSMFMHQDVYHLGGNMITLLLLGNIAERALGHVRYLILYLTGGLLAALTSMYVAFLKGDMIGAVGASGAIFAVIGAVLWILILNHGRLETLTTAKLLFLIAYSLYFGFTSTGIDNAAHVGGLLAGLMLAMILYRRKKGFSAGKRRRKENL